MPNVPGPQPGVAGAGPQLDENRRSRAPLPEGIIKWKRPPPGTSNAMAMSAYTFYPNDQKWANWVLYREIKEEPYLLVLPRYAHLLCPGCQMFDHDSALAHLLDDEVRIRAQGNIVVTDDGFCLFDSRAAQVVASNGIKGLALKPLGTTNWHIASLCDRRDSVAGVYASHSPICEKCGRFSEVTGWIEYESQIDIPHDPGTFFASAQSFRGANRRNRQILANEDVVRCFKEAGLKGGRFMRLLTREEEATMQTSLKATGKPRWPPGVQVLL